MLQTLLGTYVNAGVILLGVLFGFLLRNRLRQSVGESILQAFGVITLLLGFQMAWTANTGDRFLIVLAALISGIVTGELLQLEQRVKVFQVWVQNSRFAILAKDGGMEAAVTASLLFTVGPMAVLGSIHGGLTGDHAILMTKSVLDGVTAAVLTTTMGPGTAWSALVVFIYQGCLALAASTIAPIFTAQMTEAFSAVGGVLLVCLGIHVLELKRIRLINFLPSLFFIVLIQWLWPSW